MGKETHTLIIGASFSGLASASALQKHGIDYLIIEKEAQVATPWRHHYERLHLHTNKGLSNLPYKKFHSNIPRYPSRQQVVDYLESYQKEFNIRPIFNTEATSAKREGSHWMTETTYGLFKSKYLIVATGPFGKPKSIRFSGMETFPGKMIHSYEYKTGRNFKGQRVLVVGFGNSACEIAIDLYEKGAESCMSVRSPVSVVPRDLLGIPILQLSLILSRFPSRVADAIVTPVMRILFGDITKLGLRKMPFGVFEQIERNGRLPVLDIGTFKHIRQGHIKIYDDINFIEGKTIHFRSGRKEDFDVIVAAIGYDGHYTEIIHIDKSRFDDLKFPVDKQKHFGEDGLYFCGFWIGPTGQIREIALDAQKIAKDIANRDRRLPRIP
jgi:cation diffusion facilitator CzcD-associated flavoprotein CzcO